MNCGGGTHGAPKIQELTELQLYQPLTLRLPTPLCCCRHQHSSSRAAAVSTRSHDCIMATVPAAAVHETSAASDMHETEMHETSTSAACSAASAGGRGIQPVPTTRLRYFCCTVPECRQRPYHNSQDLIKHMASKHKGGVSSTIMSSSLRRRCAGASSSGVGSRRGLV